MSDRPRRQRTSAELAGLDVRAGAPRLAGDAVEAALAALPGWSVDAGALRKAFRFADWRATIAFVNAVADLADRAGHHPDLAVGFGRCTVAWSTHDAGGITQNDLACAARTEALAHGAGASAGSER
jgi:4a-hydroxytetrahydrobiopterin dehydratase